MPDRARRSTSHGFPAVPRVGSGVPSKQRKDPPLDGTQAAQAKQPPSRAILVTLSCLGASHAGWLAGIASYGSGQLSAFEATAAGASVAVAMSKPCLKILRFLYRDE